ncbi:glycoside hydrolase family 10 protein [Maribacter polysiphoniae]|uniref:glycoside hydrolase family 10 protein n=1 Tax=Maribacter polysiphoniae TaxID=429344 RepID=UPI0023575D0A|nr:family 10 glycosylhydrolase [Maribacter polysiphoniae]
MIKKISFLLFVLLVSSCSIIQPIPQPKTEFRGAWVATVVNIDWPKNGADSIEKKKKDFLEILEFYDAMNFNAIIVQVRAAGDAFYASEYAPWSRFLTSKEGTPPPNDFDYLAWMINESHERGIEFHAWLNPYRATFDLKTEILSPTHDFNLHPEWMVKYGKKYYYNPGLPEVQKRMVDVMTELVSNYDIDAVHFDDYFYPYKIKDETLKDSTTYTAYALPHQSLDDWRRSNIDSLIMKVHKSIKQTKPWVQFGISPFGVWKNNSTDPRGSDTKAGQTTYEDLYADPLTWMEQGWIDYLVPQVYWSMDLPVASHSKIVDWWSKNSKNTNLYIGNGAYKVRNNSDKAWDNIKELPNQLKLARKTSAVQGNVFFSAKSLMNDNHDVVNLLKKKFYQSPALSPISPLAPKMEDSPIQFESMGIKNESYELNFVNSEDYRYAIVYRTGKKKKDFYPIKKLLMKTTIEQGKSVIIPKENLKGKKRIAVTFIDKYGHESIPMLLHLN